MTLTDIKQFKKKESGFTIVELLIVIVIIGILAALVIVAYTGIQSRANTTKHKTDAQAILKKAEAYAADNNGTYAAGATSAAIKTVMDGNATSKLPTSVAVGVPDSSNKALIEIEQCPAATGGSGNQVSYWDETTSAKVSLLTSDITSC